MMTKEQLQAILRKLPAGTPILMRSGYDDAYPISVRLFEEQCVNGQERGVILYIEIDQRCLDEHRNFPEHYSGAVEQPIRKR